MTLNTRSRTLWTAAFVPALVLAIGCKKPTPVGKWSGDMGAGQAVLELKPDGALSQTGNAPMLGEFVAKGTYTLDGEKINIAVKDLEAGGKSILATLPPQVTSQFNQEATWKIEGDKLTLTRNGSNIELTRVK